MAIGPLMREVRAAGPVASPPLAPWTLVQAPPV